VREQAPGFAEFFEAGALLAAVGIKPQVLAGGEGFDWDDVPDIEWNDVSDDGVYVFGRKCDHFVLHVDVGMHAVAAVGLILGGADLDAPEALAGIEDEVIALAIAPGLGHAKAQPGNLEHEGQLGALSASFRRAGGRGLYGADFVR
jgi:hypothetical protein